MSTDNIIIYILMFLALVMLFMFTKKILKIAVIVFLVGLVIYKFFI